MAAVAERHQSAARGERVDRDEGERLRPFHRQDDQIDPPFDQPVAQQVAIVGAQRRRHTGQTLARPEA